MSKRFVRRVYDMGPYRNWGVFDLRSQAYFSTWEDAIQYAIRPRYYD